MSETEHRGLSFRRLGLGREAVVLGTVQVGEIMEMESDRAGAAFRLMLPESAASSFRPVRDRDEARRRSAAMVNDWIKAAGLRRQGEG